MDRKDIEFFATQGLEFKSVIANGGYGVIYLMFSHKYNTNFAIKTIPKEMFKESELECLKTIDDPHIVMLYNFFDFDSFVYMLMEYCPNDLEKLLHIKKSFSTEELSKYIRDCLLGIKACHDRKIAHCDIKPSNFLLDKYDRVKISDFGMSTIYSDQPKSTIFKGTSIFMSPEIFKRKEYNPLKADIWALGVTIFYLATKTFPFFAQDNETLKDLVNNLDYNKNLIENQELLDIIQRCLVVDPNERADIDELLAMPFVNRQKQDDPASPKARNLQQKASLMKRRSLINLRPSLDKHGTRSSSIQCLNALSRSSEKFKLGNN